MSSLLAVSYATWVALTNWVLIAPGSNVQTFFALAGSWISRTTTVGSPLTVPITRLSPAGTAVAQWTSEVPPEVPPGVVAGLDDGVAGALEVLVAWALGELLAVDGEPPHAENVRATTSNPTALRRTAVTVSASGSVVQVPREWRERASC